MAAKHGGRRPGAGRKPKEVEIDLADLLKRVFTPKDREAVFARLIADSKSGDHKATAILLAYAFGKPTERVEISGRDGGPVPITTIEVIKPTD